MLDLVPLILACAPGIHPALMLPLIHHESGLKPYSIGVNGGALTRAPNNPAEATATAKMLLSKGYNFDAGYTQVNSRNFARTGLTPDNAFDPCSNIAAGAMILRDCYDRAQAFAHGDAQYRLRLALSCYNTGSLTAGLKNGYVLAIEQSSQQFQAYCQRVPQTQWCRQTFLRQY